MTFDLDKLASLADQGYLRRTQHPDADLWIYNYTEKAQYGKHWTPETLACRGLILDAAGEVVARPFPKFFNLHELDAPPSLKDGGYRITEKLDGSLGILYELDGLLYIATRGSFTSEQALEGTAILRERSISLNEGATPLFEIIYPENRIVCDYGKRRDLILLAEIDNATGRDTWRLPTYSGPNVVGHNEIWEDLVDEDRPGLEGYVVSFESGLRVKIKHEEYVRLHRIVTGINSRRIWEALRDGLDPTEALEGVPDEIFAWVGHEVERLRASHGNLEIQATHAFERRPQTSDRRALAEYFKGSDFPNPSVLFRMLDGKSTDELLWKMVKPEPTTPDRQLAEAAA